MITHDRAEINLDDRAALNSEYPYGVDAGVAELYEGKVQLVITPFESFRQVKTYRSHLEAVKDIDIVSQMWSEEDGASIIIEVKKPLALDDLLCEMPEVARTQSDGDKSSRGSRGRKCKKMVVIMKNPEETISPVTL